MIPFREENRYLVYISNASGLGMKSIYYLIDNQILKYFFHLWTILPLILFPAYVGMDIRGLFYQDMDLLERFGMVRKIVAFLGFWLKNVVFFFVRDNIEVLIDKWDKSFKGDLYSEQHKILRQNTKKENKSLVGYTMFFSFASALTYSVPGYFSKTKELNHPSGIEYPHRSPYHEIVVTIDCVMSMFSPAAVAFDLILVVFLSLVRAEMVFLRDVLTDLINEIIIDDNERLLRRIPGKYTLEKNFVYNEYIKGSQNKILVLRDPDQREFDLKLYEEIELNSKEYNEAMEAFEVKLRLWLHHHQQLIRFFDVLKEVFIAEVTIESLQILLYTGLTALHIVLVRPSLLALGIALVAVTNTVTLFLWCKTGADLGSIDLFENAFGRAWLYYPKKIQTAFSFIIMRCKKPLTLRGAAFLNMNLLMFFKIMKLTYQFFAFALQVTS